MDRSFLRGYLGTKLTHPSKIIVQALSYEVSKKKEDELIKFLHSWRYGGSVEDEMNRSRKVSKYEN